MTKFEDIQFNNLLKRSIQDLKYENATEVQDKVIPAIIGGENIVCRSHTGSGKTLAFGIPLSHRILNGQSKKVLIIGPTRELVVQVRTELSLLNRHSRLKVYNVYGGHGMIDEQSQLRKGVDILVATPGRLLDHFKRRVIQPRQFDTVVLDEADRTLDMGFITDIKQILGMIEPKNVHLFSATLEGKVASLIHSFISKYKEIILPAEIIGKTIIEKDIEVTRGDKYKALLDIITQANGKKVLVFVSKKYFADSLCEKLGKNEVGAVSIHGDKTQKNRELSLKDFKTGRTQVMIATDVAARGLQIEDIEFVVNYDAAMDRDTHKHRIGRTGRMGKTGYAINFIESVPVNYDPSRDRGGFRSQRSKARSSGASFKGGHRPFRKNFSHNHRPSGRNNRN